MNCGQNGFHILVQFYVVYRLLQLLSTETRLLVRMHSAEITATIQIFSDRLVSQEREASPSVYIRQVDIDR